MRKIYLCCLALILLFCSSVFAQDPAKYQWETSSKKIADKKYELIFSTTGLPGWQLYAPNQEPGGVKAVDLIIKDSSIIIEKNFAESGESKTFNSSIFDNASVKVYEGRAEWKATIHFTDQVPAQLQGSVNYFYGKNDEFYPEALNFNVQLEGGVSNADSSLKVRTIDINNPVKRCGDEGTNDKSILTIFLLGFLGGFIALLTPCVFPMVPVTVTFFTKKSNDRSKGMSNAILYGTFIFLIYVLITVPFHIASTSINKEIFNNISTNVGLNIFFFAVFVFFALSFFGLFEIGLPSGLANKADSKSGLGNIGGIFFMASTLAIVSFSCTGPILGTLLVGVAEQGAWPLTAGAAGFGLALGLPFALFAMFPAWLQSLPKSGGWMTDVKVVLGFVELALAVKFLSNADLVKQWGLLKREVFIGLWILIGLLTVLYLLGVLKFSHSSPVKKYSFTRIAFIVLFTSFTVYLMPGLTNGRYADLKLISGFPPPRTTYSLYNSDDDHKEIFEPLQNKYQEALAIAKRENKPVLIDFTGWACVNCRRMEEKVWPNKIVDSLMRNEFIVVSLYVDERTSLPLTERTTVKVSDGKEKSIITIGDKWSTFQTENFGATSQPQYAIITPDQKALTKTKFYTPNADEFIKWLNCGVEAYKEINAKK
jgi:thiol:disulfide interchange protein DsbD